jgi:tRNA(Ile)-lysidine synthase
MPITKPAPAEPAPFLASLAAAWPPPDWEDVTVLVAVSGGADSIALLRGMAALRSAGPGRLVAAHFNHGLRGADSDGDETFVAALCEKIGLHCERGRGQIDARGARQGDGLEAAARSVRYAFLAAAARRHGARYVATAHTANDQAETILHHILRGTGLDGLAGMPRARILCDGVTLIRPMLGLRRAEVLAFLDSLGQPYREDAMNADVSLTRSRIRHALLPMLAAEYNASVEDALLRLGRLAGEARDVIDGLVAPLFAAAVRREGPDQGEAAIDCQRLAGQPPYLVRELLSHVWRERGWPAQEMGFAEWHELAEMADSEATRAAPPQRNFPGGVTARREGNVLRLWRAANNSPRGDAAR